MATGQSMEDEFRSCRAQATTSGKLERSSGKTLFPRKSSLLAAIVASSLPAGAIAAFSLLVVIAVARDPADDERANDIGCGSEETEPTATVSIAKA